jgi:hypothetical protein
MCIKSLKISLLESIFTDEPMSITGWLSQIITTEPSFLRPLAVDFGGHLELKHVFQDVKIVH